MALADLNNTYILLPNPFRHDTYRNRHMPRLPVVFLHIYFNKENVPKTNENGPAQT